MQRETLRFNPLEQMMNPQTPPSAGDSRLRTTDELAAELGIAAQSIRKRYSQTGTYFDLRPVKLPNRRLLWPADAFEQLIRRGA